MSEPEDDSVLRDEIKALEDVLAADETSQSSIVEVVERHNLTDATSISNCESRGFGEVVTLDAPRPLVHGTSASSRSALKINRELLEVLRESKRELLVLLDKCVRNKEMVALKIKERTKNPRTAKIPISIAGMPYFKDADCFAAPPNDDTLMKSRSDELQVSRLRAIRPWTVKDRNILWKAVRQDAASAALALAQLDDDESSNVDGGKTGAGTSRGFNLPKNFKEMVGPLGAKEFDWMKISLLEFHNKHTPEECRVMWNVLLHPDINRYRWTSEEDRALEILTKKYNYQDWDAIAKELGTNRSSYQCFVRFNNNGKNTGFKQKFWSKTEDQLLHKCVDTLKVGDYIPWGEVSQYLEGRTKIQIYCRWKYNSAPHLKKGRFTPEEDAELMEAVKLYDTDFGKISCLVMPNRTSVQLSNHYFTLLQKKRGIKNTWTIDEDSKLLNFYEKFGCDWSKIAEKFSNKTRTQLRHRYRSIMRYREKGVSLYEIPRHNDDMETSMENKEIVELKNCGIDENFKQLENIDLELIKYFQVAPPVLRPGRKSKYYKNDELDEATRKLYVILEILKADLQIPNKLDDIAITDKDRQLLTSLREYKILRNTEITNKSNNLKYSRNSRDDGDLNATLHFSPLCNGNCNKNEKFRIDDILDYVAPHSLDCTMTLNDNFVTPKNVVESIGHEKNEEFDYVSKFLKSQKIAINRPTVVTKIYVLGPEMCSKALITLAPRPENSRTVEKIGDDSKSRKKCRRGRRGKIWDCSVNEGIIYRPGGRLHCVEPNYHTLLGLQHVMAHEDISNLPENDVNANKEFLKSLKILKNRLLQLFEYPIGLSRVLRPEIYARRVGMIEGVDDDDEVGQDSKGTSEPPVKIRRLGNKKRETSK